MTDPRDRGAGVDAQASPPGVAAARSFPVRVRLFGVLDRSTLDALGRDGGPLADGTRWTIEDPVKVDRCGADSPLHAVSRDNTHRHHHLTHEIAVLGTAHYVGFPASSMFRRVTLDLHSSLVYTFQVTATVDAPPLDPSGSLWPLLAPRIEELQDHVERELGVSVGLAVATVSGDDCRPATPDMLLTAPAGDSRELISASRIGDEYLVKGCDAGIDTCIVLHGHSREHVDDLALYKYLIVAHSLRLLRDQLREVADQFQKVLRSLDQHDPLASPSRELVESISRGRSEALKTTEAAQDVRARREISQLFTSTMLSATPRSGMESPLFDSVPPVLETERAEVARFLGEPVDLLAHSVTRLEESAHERLRSLSEIVALRFDARIQHQLRWLQIIAVLVAAAALAVGIANNLNRTQQTVVVRATTHASHTTPPPSLQLKQRTKPHG